MSTQIETTRSLWFPCADGLRRLVRHLSGHEWEVRVQVPGESGVGEQFDTTVDDCNTVEQAVAAVQAQAEVNVRCA